MSLATLLNVPVVGDQNGFDEFSFSNQDSHIRIINAISAQKGTALQIYQVDAMAFGEDGEWLQSYQHQAMHNDMNAVTGVSSNDLSAPDWNDPQQSSYWHQLHWNEHQQNEQRLGILSNG